MDHENPRTAMKSTAVQQFVDLLDNAIYEARRIHIETQSTGGPYWLREDSERVIENLEAWKERATRGDLPRSAGAGMGLARAVGEWAQGTPLMDAVYAVERHFKNVLA